MFCKRDIYVIFYLQDYLLDDESRLSNENIHSYFLDDVVPEKTNWGDVVEEGEREREDVVRNKEQHVSETSTNRERNERRLEDEVRTVERSTSDDRPPAKRMRDEVSGQDARFKGNRNRTGSKNEFYRGGGFGSGRGRPKNTTRQPPVQERQEHYSGEPPYKSRNPTADKDKVETKQNVWQNRNAEAKKDTANAVSMVTKEKEAVLKTRTSVPSNKSSDVGRQCQPNVWNNKNIELPKEEHQNVWHNRNMEFAKTENVWQNKKSELVKVVRQKSDSETKQSVIKDEDLQKKEDVKTDAAVESDVKQVQKVQEKREQEVSSTNAAVIESKLEPVNPWHRKPEPVSQTNVWLAKDLNIGNDQPGGKSVDSNNKTTEWYNQDVRMTSGYQGGNDRREGGNDRREGGNDRREGGNDRREGRNDRREGGNDRREGGNDRREGGNDRREGGNDRREGGNDRREGGK